MIKISNYLVKNYKGKYRLKVPTDLVTNQYPKKLNDTYEDIDMYIECQYGNKIFNYGRGTLQAYIPSLIRGHNIIKSLQSEYGQDIIFNIEDLDSEVLFRFKAKDDDKVIPLLKPKVNGANISPFSSKNLPKTKYTIPYDKLEEYKNIVAKIPKEDRLSIGHMTKKYLQSLVTKKNTWDKIKDDMVQKGLKGKEYIHAIGKFNEYLRYLEENIK